MDTQQIENICKITFQHLNLKYSKEKYFFIEEIEAEDTYECYFEIVKRIFPQILSICVKQYCNLPIRIEFYDLGDLQNAMTLICGETICEICATLLYFTVCGDRKDLTDYSCDSFTKLMLCYPRAEKAIIEYIFENIFDDKLEKMRDNLIDALCHAEFKDAYFSNTKLFALFSVNDNIYEFCALNLHKTFDESLRDVRAQVMAKTKWW